MSNSYQDLLLRAIIAYDHRWPTMLTSGVMYFEGTAIDRRTFEDAVFLLQSTKNRKTGTLGEKPDLTLFYEFQESLNELFAASANLGIKISTIELPDKDFLKMLYYYGQAFPNATISLKALLSDEITLNTVGGFPVTIRKQTNE